MLRMSEFPLVCEQISSGPISSINFQLINMYSERGYGIKIQRESWDKNQRGKQFHCWKQICLLPVFRISNFVSSISVFLFPHSLLRSRSLHLTCSCDVVFGKQKGFRIRKPEPKKSLKQRIYPHRIHSTTNVRSKATITPRHSGIFPWSKVRNSLEVLENSRKTFTWNRLYRKAFWTGNVCVIYRIAFRTCRFYDGSDALARIYSEYS